jgi:hypothetical protein
VLLREDASISFGGYYRITAQEHSANGRFAYSGQFKTLAAKFLRTLRLLLRNLGSIVAGSESPMAMACLLPFTFPHRPPFPDRSVPCFLRRTALAIRFLPPYHICDARSLFGWHVFLLSPRPR